MRRLIAVPLVLALAACGGSDSGNPVAPAPAPTPAPVNYSGNYTGTMLYNVAGLAEVRPIGTINVTHSGSNVTFGSLTLGTPVNGTFPIGSGTMTGDTVNAGTSYQSSGCGTVTTQTTARFAGNLVNLTTVLTATGNCARSEMRGELRRP
jgi:hypothetical protein